MYTAESWGGGGMISAPRMSNRKKCSLTSCPMQKIIDTGARVKLEVWRNLENNNIVFGSYCQCYPATTAEVDFSMNSSMKEEIQAKSVCTTLTIAALKNTEPNTNLLYTIRATVAIGNDDPDEIDTRYGRKEVKRDLYLSDSSGNVNFQVFTNKHELFENDKSYQISHVKLNKFRGIVHVRLTYDSEVEEIQQISNAAKKVQLKTVTVNRLLPLGTCKSSTSVAAVGRTSIVKLTRRLKNTRRWKKTRRWRRRRRSLRRFNALTLSEGLTL